MCAHRCAGSCAGVVLAATVAACSGGSDGADSFGSTPLVVQQSGIASTDDRIVAEAVAGRSDPEGLAPSSPELSRITWKDGRHADRVMSLYGYLYQYDFSLAGATPDLSLSLSRSAGDAADGHAGFGYVVSHNTETGNSPLGKQNAPTRVQSRVFAGGHHAIHRVELTYDRDLEPGGRGLRIPVVIEWFVATGRDHPVWAVTYKMGAALNPQGVDLDQYRMDVRGPYGSLNFDGAPNAASGDEIGGVAWGDGRLSFRSQGSPLTLNSPWTYTTPHPVNYVQAWTANANAEFGIVQTRLSDQSMGYPDRVAGRERGASSEAAYAQKGNCTAWEDLRLYAMPCVSGWPYQMMNFDWDASSGKPADEPTRTKLMAWGSPYGWLGASSFPAFDGSQTFSGLGDRSHATFIVLGPRCRYNPAGACALDGDVALQLREVQALAAAEIDAQGTGRLAARAPKGPDSSESKGLLNGYDDTYAVFRLEAEANRADFVFRPSPGWPVTRPVFVIRPYTARQLPQIEIDGAPVPVNTGTADGGAFVSIDTDNDELWVTLNRVVSGASRVRIGF